MVKAKLKPAPVQIEPPRFKVYTGEELKPLPGLTADRYAAYKLPSRNGSWLLWPDGRREQITSEKPKS